VTGNFSDPDRVVRRAMRAWRPPPKLTLSQWADEYFVMSAESSAEPGRWKTLPYQRGIMDAISDPCIPEVTVEKSARIGFTLILSAAAGYYMHQDPTSILVVQPTVEDGKEYSKETIAPMLTDVPVLAALRFRDVADKGPKGSSNTMTHKKFPGGLLSIAGANSATGLRRKSRRVIFFDEVDAYPPSAGSEGDPIELGKKRARSYWNRKIVEGSTPLLADNSRIDELFLQGDRRRYYVPCPECGHMDFLVFSQRKDERGHYLKWPEGKPRQAHFVCSKNGCVIEHRKKRWMVERGQWRAEKPFDGHASFHIWAAYSYGPNETWGQLAEEFLIAKAGGPLKLKTFVNTVLGETWAEKGEAPPWETLYRRRECYDPNVVPPGVRLVTAGVDVQRDRIIYEVVAWLDDKSSYSLEEGSIHGSTATAKPWAELAELLQRTWASADGIQYAIRMMAVDSGDQTQTVYNWCRQYPMSRVIAVKGVASAHVLIAKPSKVDVTVSGRVLPGAYRVWPVGVSVAKTELYGWLHLEPPTRKEDPFPPGFCHFPDSHGEEFFKELTAEQLVPVKTRHGYMQMEWCLIANRQNHALDARVYARCAAALCGLDRHSSKKSAQANQAAKALPAPGGQTEAPRKAPPPKPARREGWLGTGRGFLRGRGSWLGRR
jgi:phage terminase large subunit GpA-like protein